MENIATITIETERLLLVPITMQYAEEIFNEFTPEITTYMFPKAAETIAETESFIQSSIERMNAWTNYQAVILDKNTKEFLGCVGLHIKNPVTPELGIRIKKSAFGKKIGREAVAGLTNRARENLDFEYLFYPVDKDNVGSRKIAESLGGVVQKNPNGEEIVKIKDTMYPNRKMNSVEYRIPKKISLPEWLQITKDISDTDYAEMIAIMEQNDSSRYLIEKEQFLVIKDKQEHIVAFGRLYEIGPDQWELSSVRVDESQRGKKLWLALSQKLIQEKWADKEIYLATKKSLEHYYQKIWFHIITEDIPEKLIYTGKRAEEQGIEFIIMKLGK